MTTFVPILTYYVSIRASLSSFHKYYIICSCPLPLAFLKMIGLYRRRKSDTTDAALDFAPSADISGGGGLQHANVNALQDEIDVLKKKLYEVCYDHFTQTLDVKRAQCHKLYNGWRILLLYVSAVDCISLCNIQ